MQKFTIHTVELAHGTIETGVAGIATEARLYSERCCDDGRQFGPYRRVCRRLR